MPFISTKVSVSIPEEKLEILKTGYGSAITLISGKREARLMLQFEDNCKMYFGGENQEAIAYVQVNLYGTAQDTDCNNLTAELTSILEKELGIKPAQVFISYYSTVQWGNNGKNM